MSWGSWGRLRATRTWPSSPAARTVGYGGWSRPVHASAAVRRSWSCSMRRPRTRRRGRRAGDAVSSRRASCGGTARAGVELLDAVGTGALAAEGWGQGRGARSRPGVERRRSRRARELGGLMETKKAPERVFRQESLIRSLGRRISAIDREWFERIAAWHTPVLDRTLPTISEAANNSALWMGYAAVLATTGGRSGRRAATRGLASVAVTSAVVSLGVKMVARRRRPDAPGTCGTPPCGECLEAPRSRPVTRPAPRRSPPAPQSRCRNRRSCSARSPAPWRSRESTQACTTRPTSPPGWSSAAASRSFPDAYGPFNAWRRGSDAVSPSGSRTLISKSRGRFPGQRGGPQEPHAIDEIATYRSLLPIGVDEDLPQQYGIEKHARYLPL